MNKCVKVHALRKTGLKLIDYTVYLIVDIQISIYTIYISIVNVSLLAIALCTYICTVSPTTKLLVNVSKLDKV